ncbi:hypothetical protein Daura_14895 [Dactylosporangium aurantiacum]|uniref:DUF4386 family protein n=1 Tax=Dactylosporangium aurantiacum TaxID=35754 RepID=A0A9Q9INV6_9ACTN|nr:hypothetical protein [Dactylosporangium aurantiacum]MDG6108484.1 hypothetical protein [Dactylosporangium aurantiacum]UWZ57335.1 hypothetical protein Daura_14895 [Dactylosporangium aurantiacum]
MNTTSNNTARVLTYAAGGSLVAGAAGFFAGLATSPPSGGDDKAAYLRSLAADPFQTQLSALLLHYGNLLMGVGLLALPLLVRGRRGAVLTLVGALLGALTLLEMSGALLSDWFHMEIGRNLPVEQAVALSDKVLAHPAQQLAFSPGPLVSLALLLTFAGLARAGVLGWWSLGGIVLGYAGLLFLPYDTPILPALGTLPMLAVMAAAGLRVLGRARIAPVGTGLPAAPEPVAAA